MKRKTEPLNQDELRALKILVRQRNDYMQSRKRAYNRLGLKKDGTPQNVEARTFTAEDFAVLQEDARFLAEREHTLDLEIGRRVRRVPIYKEFLQEGVKGVSTTTASQLICMIDIERATTVSKIWQYAGLNPGKVRGKKRVALDKYKGDESRIVQRFDMPDGSVQVAYLTDELIRGDRRTEGFVAPFNGDLRTLVAGVMADCFIKAQNSYTLDFYYPYKDRKKHSTEMVQVGKEKFKPWCETTDAHRHNAARRYMMKMFLRDLYVCWRTIEGLPVRESYAEEYLGKTHNEGVAA